MTSGGRMAVPGHLITRTEKTTRSNIHSRPFQVDEDDFVPEAKITVELDFPNSIGVANTFNYPTNHVAAKKWLIDFIDSRLNQFGDFEDAMSAEQDVLFHSVLTPMLNIGLLSPKEAIDAALSRQSQVPINALEGFIRQVIGWREFMRLAYLKMGRQQQTSNFWGFSRAKPKSFYTGSTGIDPVDTVIQRILRTGYFHHIERLILLGSFMLLCEIHPDHVYRWFMENFIDAYDWIMVPNIYGMSQYAEGGKITT